MEKSHDQEDVLQPFLGECSDENQTISHRCHASRCYTGIWIGLLLASILAHATLATFWLAHERVHKSYFILPNPFEDVFSTKIQKLQYGAWSDSIYVGEPSERLDKAWDNLQPVIGMRLSPEEASAINLTYGMRTKNGDLVVEPAVFHNIHCLRYLYQILHRDSYVDFLTSIKGDPEVIGLEHTYHCIETLRDSITCKPDLNIYAVDWTSDKSNLVLRTDVHRECVDRDPIWDAALSREVTPFMLADAEDSFLGPFIKKYGQD